MGTNLRKLKITWQNVIFIDEVMLKAKGIGDSWRLVRRPQGTPRSDPKFCRGKFKWPRKIMALAGITASGSCFLSFLKSSVMMNSVKYCKMLKGEPKWIVRSKR